MISHELSRASVECFCNAACSRLSMPPPAKSHVSLTVSTACIFLSGLYCFLYVRSSQRILAASTLIQVTWRRHANRPCSCVGIKFCMGQYPEQTMLRYKILTSSSGYTVTLSRLGQVFAISGHRPLRDDSRTLKLRSVSGVSSYPHMLYCSSFCGGTL